MIDYEVIAPRTQKGHPILQPMLITYDYNGNISTIVCDRERIKVERHILEQAEKE